MLKQLTARDPSRAFLTTDGAERITGAGTAFLPVLDLSEVKGISYPFTSPWDIFQMNTVKLQS